jgi:hypothetical protein
LTQTVKGPCSFAPFDVRVQGMPPSWRVHLRTQGQSDVYYVDNVFAPGASTGWHSHPGPSFVLVVSGTVTNYEGGSGHCTITRYSAGSGFMDEGGNGNDVHMIKNDTAEPAETIALQSSPRAPRGGSTSRIPAPARGSRNQPEWQYGGSRPGSHQKPPRSRKHSSPASRRSDHEDGSGPLFGPCL